VSGEHWKLEVQFIGELERFLAEFALCLSQQLASLGQKTTMSHKLSECFHRERFLVTSSKEVTKETLCTQKATNGLV